MSEGKLKKFYNSQAWELCRLGMIESCIKADSEQKLRCSRCGKVLVDKGDIIVHHTPIELTEENVANVNISLNPENLKIVCFKCHNDIHGRTWNGKHFKRRERAVYIVYGPPCSGKTTFVRNNMKQGDIVIDLDRIYQAISFCQLYSNPDSLLNNTLAVRDKIIENIKYKYGGWKSAWIIGGYPQKAQREKLAADLGAELVYIETTYEQCIERLKSCTDYRGEHFDEWKEYIRRWFDRFTS